MFCCSCWIASIRSPRNPLFEAFKTVINKRKLLEMLGSQNACESFLASSDAKSLELKLLSKIIRWFLLKLHYLRILNGRQRTCKKVSSCMLALYTAEIKSRQYSVYSRSHALNISRKKSALPFVLIYLVTQL